jgi:hypothetical protein
VGQAVGAPLEQARQPQEEQVGDKAPLEEHEGDGPPFEEYLQEEAGTLVHHHVPRCSSLKVLLLAS